MSGSMTDMVVERIAERIMNVLFRDRDCESPLTRAVRSHIKSEILAILHGEIG